MKLINLKKKKKRKDDELMGIGGREDHSIYNSANNLFRKCSFSRAWGER